MKDLTTEKLEAFNASYGISDICDSKNVFLYDGKRYKFSNQFLEPSVTMKCLDDDSTLSFAVSSPLKDELVLE
jgi:hypothetical protein